MRFMTVDDEKQDAGLRRLCADLKYIFGIAAIQQYNRRICSCTKFDGKHFKMTIKDSKYELATEYKINVFVFVILSDLDIRLYKCLSVLTFIDY